MDLAVILNSGTGSRMGELTKDKPKCLVEIGSGETILSRQVKSLQEAGIGEILITTGPFAGKLEAYLETNFNGLNFTYINNPRYSETNYIYSLLLAGETILNKLAENDSLLMLHGDLVFDQAVLEKLIRADAENSVVTNPHLKLPEKDFKGEINKGRVRRIGVDVFGEACVFLIPLYKLSKQSFAAWLEEMNRFEKEGRLKVYAEDALNNLLGELYLYPVALGREFCTEIDDQNDLAMVKRYLGETG